MISQRGVALLGTLLLIAFSTPTPAQPPAAPAVDIVPTASAGGETTAHPAWVQIEVIVLRQLDTTSAGNEHWPDDPELSYPEPLLRLDDPTADMESGLEGTVPPAMHEPVAFRQLDASQRVLGAEAARIGGSADYRLLTHRAWRQPDADGSTTHLLITGGVAHGEHHELEGSVTIRNLDTPEVSLRLWLNDFTAATPGTGVVLPAIPRPIVEDESIAIEPTRATRSVVLQATRRLAPGELHYVDHPLFGVLITAIPVDVPPPSATPPSPSAAPSVAPGDG